MKNDLRSTIVVLASIALSTPAACGGASADQRVVAGADAGLSCELPNIVNAVAQLLPALGKLVVGLIRGDGTFDHDALVAAAQPFRDTAFQCAMDAAVAAATASAPTGTARATTSGTAATAARQQWAEIKTQLGWKIVSTAR